LTRKSGYINWSLLERMVDQCADGRHSIDWLHGTGEPLLWDRLEEVIQLIRSRNAGKATFATNATILDKHRVESLLDAGLGEIYISLDSLNKDIYKATRAGKLEKVVKNIKVMMGIVPKDFGITIALMNHKLQTLTDVDVALFRETSGDRPKLKLVETGIMPSAREDCRLAPHKVPTCSTPANYFFIAHDGRVGLCCSDQDLMHVIGDTRFQTIDEIWFAAENQKTFRNIGLGIGSCPEVCTKHCHLKDPANLAWLKLDGGVEFGTWLPFNDPPTVRAVTKGDHAVGWSFVEDWGTWTEGHEAILSISLPQIAADLRLEVEIAHVLRPSGSQSVAISAEDRAIDRWTFAKGEFPTIRRVLLPRTVIRGKDRVEIKLRIEQPVSPRALNETSDDRRLLGVGIARIRLSPVIHPHRTGPP
jgi:hypothetical protein